MSSCAVASASVRSAGDDTLDGRAGRRQGVAEESPTWRSSGIDDATLIDALGRSQFSHPTRIQQLGMPALLSGRDVVMAAETGCGKTLAYLLPLANKHAKLLSSRGTGLADLRVDMDGHGADMDGGGAGSSSSSLYWEGKTDADGVCVWHAALPSSLILCPNQELCRQVERVASSVFRDRDGVTIFPVSAVTSSAPPIRKPAGGGETYGAGGVVATPAGLWTWLRDHWGLKSSFSIGFVRNLRSVVLDEGDMLFSGGYIRPLQSLLAYMESVRLHPGDADVLKKVRKDTKFSQKHEYNTRSLAQAVNTFDASREAFVGSREYLTRMQSVVVAATLPSRGVKSIASEIEYAFPSAVYVLGDQLHRHSAKLAHEWVRVEGECARAEELVRALRSRSTGASRTIVFANSQSAVDRITDDLRSRGFLARAFHTGIDRDVRGKVLDFFAANAALPDEGHGSGGGREGEARSDRDLVLVCTDTASRGLDIERVDHVVNAEFPTNAVDFLHRVGRTARQGRSGRVTTLFESAQLDLVARVRDAVEKQQPIEEIFSRNRQFRKALRKERLRETGSGERGVEEEEDSRDRGNWVR